VALQYSQNTPKFFLLAQFQGAGLNRHSALALRGSCVSGVGTQIRAMLGSTDKVCFGLTKPWPWQQALMLAPTVLEGFSVISRAAVRTHFLSVKQRPIQFNDREGTQGCSAARAAAPSHIRVSRQCKRLGGWRVGSGAQDTASRPWLRVAMTKRNLGASDQCFRI
jgi:hypothetical protein